MSYSTGLGFNLDMPILPDEFWPNAEVGGKAIYSFDATTTITSSDGVVDPVASVSFSTRPSGMGELSALSVIVVIVVVDGANRTFVNVVLSGGVASRNYIHQLVITTQGGQILPVLIGQVCDPVLAIPPVPPPPSPVFGTAVNWP